MKETVLDIFHEEMKSGGVFKLTVCLLIVFHNCLPPSNIAPELSSRSFMLSVAS